MITRQLGIVLALSLSICACSSPAQKHSIGIEGPTGDSDGGLPTGHSLVVEESLEIAPGKYFRPAQGDGGVIVFDGAKDIEVDLTNVILQGTPQGSAPDEGSGVGILIRNCEGVHLRGGQLRGYRVALHIVGSDDVRIEGLTVDPVFGRRLIGTTTLPDPNDRLQIQLDASDRWGELYGAAILIENSSRVEVRDCRARGGQNGLLALNSEGGQFINNDFSYLSGWGIALAHCDKTTVSGNRCDSITRRGTGGRVEPDHGATGILITGGSSENLICGNSAQRCSAGGREMFGGQASGRGNRWIANDFSGAECISMDLDRSQDTWLIGNRILGSRGPGISARSTVRLAIHDNHIETIHGAGISLQGGSHSYLWENEILDCDLGLEVIGDAQVEDAEPMDHWIASNRFSENVQDLVLEHGVGMSFSRNEFDSKSTRPHLDGLSGIDPKDEEGVAQLTSMQIWSWLADKDGHLPSGRSRNTRLRRSSVPRPESTRRIAAWSPPAELGGLPRALESARETLGRATILGEFGPWDPASGKPRPGSRRARGLLAGALWDATWFEWDTESDPRGDLERWRSRRYEPLARADVEVWNDPWGGSAKRKRELVAESFGLIATTEIVLEEGGTFLLSELSDDGLRITVDDEVVLEDWSWHPERQRSSEIILSPGSHRLKLEYFQIDGTAVLSLELRELPGS